MLTIPRTCLVGWSGQMRSNQKLQIERFVVVVFKSMLALHRLGKSPLAWSHHNSNVRQQHDNSRNKNVDGNKPRQVPTFSRAKAEGQPYLQRCVDKSRKWRRVIYGPSGGLRSVKGIWTCSEKNLRNSRPVYSLMLSSHLFFCLPCLLPPFSVPCKMVWARPDDHTSAVCVSLR